MEHEPQIVGVKSEMLTSDRVTLRHDVIDGKRQRLRLSVDVLLAYQRKTLNPELEGAGLTLKLKSCSFEDLAHSLCFFTLIVVD